MQHQKGNVFYCFGSCDLVLPPPWVWENVRSIPHKSTNGILTLLINNWSQCVAVIKQVTIYSRESTLFHLTKHKHIMCTGGDFMRGIAQPRIKKSKEGNYWNVNLSWGKKWKKRLKWFIYWPNIVQFITVVLFSNNTLCLMLLATAMQIIDSNRLHYCVFSFMFVIIKKPNSHAYKRKHRNEMNEQEEGGGL